MLLSIFWVHHSVAQKEIDSLQRVVETTSGKPAKLKVLDQLTRAMIRGNHKNLIPRLQEYVALAKELKEYDLMASKSRFIIQQYIIVGEIKKGKELCEAMLAFKPHFKKKNSEAHLLLKRAGLKSSELDYHNAIGDFDKAAALFLEAKDSIFSADAYFFSGQASSNSGDFITAIEKYEKAKDLYEILKDYNYMFSVAGESLLLYRRIGLRDIANEKTSVELEKAKALKANFFVGFCYLSLAEEALKDQQLQVAKQYLDSSEAYNKYNKDITTVSSRGMQYKAVLLRSLLAEKNMKAADSVYGELLEVEKKIRNKYLLSSVKPDKVKYLLEKKRYREALSLLGDYKGVSSNSGVENLYGIEVEKLLGEIYEKLNNPNKALEHQKNYNQLRDSVNKQTLLNAFAFHQTRFETAEKEKELIKKEAAITELEKDKELASSKRNTLVAILFSVILVAVGIFWWERRKKKELKRALDRNTKELTTYTQQLLERSKEQQSLKNQLEELKEQVTEKNIVDTVQELLSSKILTKDDWYVFKDKFVKVHPSFFGNIKSKGYKLTKAEERLVALEKLGLDNQEIANILGISVESIFISRYRLRKKIKAPKEISLVEYLD